MQRVHHDQEAGQEARETHHRSRYNHCEVMESEVTDKGDDCYEWSCKSCYPRTF